MWSTCVAKEVSEEVRIGSLEMSGLQLISDRASDEAVMPENTIKMVLK